MHMFAFCVDIYTYLIGEGERRGVNSKRIHVCVRAHVVYVWCYFNIYINVYMHIYMYIRMYI